MMKKHTILLTLILCCMSAVLSAQTAPEAPRKLTLEQCYEDSRLNFPMIKQHDLIEQSRDFSLKNARSAWYPQFGLSARATYQSEVIEIPIKIPGVEIPTLRKEQYQVVAEMNQTIWDGGIARAEKKGVKASYELDSKRLEVDLYALRERVNSMFFGILMLNEQLTINELLNTELLRNLKQVESYVQNGVATSADVDAVNVEILTNSQKRNAIIASLKAYLSMLSQMVGYDVREVVKPEMPKTDPRLNNRPELAMFDAQIAQIEIQRAAIAAKNLPKLGLFVQGAYGSPGLNMLNPNASPYAIGGVRLSWSFGSLYNRGRDLSKIALQKQTVTTQKETFLYNSQLSISQIDGEVQRLREQMKDDRKIIELRGNIKRSAEAKTAAGTMSVTDMLREVTAENTAIATEKLRGIELLMNLYIIKDKANN